LQEQYEGRVLQEKSVMFTFRNSPCLVYHVVYVLACPCLCNIACQPACIRVYGKGSGAWTRRWEEKGKVCLYLLFKNV